MVPQASSWRFFPVALVLILPVILCIGVTWVESQREVRGEAATAAGIVRHQTDTILSHAWQVVDTMTPLLEAPCEKSVAELQKMGTLSPYFRALMFTRGDTVYCSSVLGEVDASTLEFHGWPTTHSPNRWVAAVTGTPLVPARAAVLAAGAEINGRRAVAIVDGQYLQDVLDSVALLGQYVVELHLGKGGTFRSAISLGDPATHVRVYTSRADQDDVASERISVFVSRDRQLLAWQRLVLSYLPFTIVLSAAFALLAYRLQRTRNSFKEMMRRAIKAGEFHVQYQPVYAQSSGACEGVEALMRWERPGVGLVRPDLFIGMAEEEGMIIPLTRHLMALVERDFKTWNTPAGFHVGLNIAPEHLSSPEMQTDVRAFIACVADREPLVVLEITERSLIENTGQARRNIDALRAEGVRVAIDDFGTGRCSFSYLQQFPVDYLKVDQGFVQAIDASLEDTPVLDAIISLAHRLGLAIVAEGVETQAQFHYLTQRGVQFIQGYLFARPMRSADFMVWYATHKPGPPA